MHGGHDDDDSEQAVIRDYKDSLVRGLAPSTITVWIEKIVETANALCGSSSAAIKYKKGEAIWAK
ncbi:hypothetical protein NTE_00798 [Candidatus Nitrososphaera evergladensis SR1]|uniref:Uncharacterized protein n=1 Tax=Candidatus Nitrososphaera evergladensis SR1 TaxID=1459636 RepID=A0A075MN10_9ARCH|nr:hypothetical protein [Candidatus Nitrososphaera evergladensis]AIF82876.1 hypothetical protein NTE_00798 [Candidatus Nitrososphaera evergladensis SR1]